MSRPQAADGFSYAGYLTSVRGVRDMKILVINGSPKGSGSNTYKLTKAFLAGMEESAEAADETFEAEEIQVNQREIRPCLGCFSCWSKTPLFMKTNWIQTLMWGILYLLTPIWTYFIMGTQIKSYIGAVNSILPIFMGIFTVWFEKRYPAKIASGR